MTLMRVEHKFRDQTWYAGRNPNSLEVDLEVETPEDRNEDKYQLNVKGAGHYHEYDW